MKRRLILFIGLCLTVWHISQVQEGYVKLGNDCFDKGDYDCAKKNYNAQKTFGSATGVDAKIAQCNQCIEILPITNFLFSDKDYVRAKAKYQELLNINPKDPHAKKQIELCDKAIKGSETPPNTNPTPLPSSSPASKTLQGVTTAFVWPLPFSLLLGYLSIHVLS